MKSLNQYIKEKLIINQRFDEKLIINQRFDEKLIINKNYSDAGLSPKSFNELRKIIEDRYDKFGAGTKQDPIDFNDIDVSNLNSFCNDNDNGLFEKTKFKYIDISDWNVSSVTNMLSMFYRCNELKSVGDISKWDVSNVTNMAYMFTGCANLNQDISRWIVSRVTDMSYMFFGCVSFNQDISKWDVSNVRNNDHIFKHCPIKDEYKPKFK